MLESVKSDAKESIDAIKALGVEVKLLSGDQHETVMHFADIVGVTDAKGNFTPQDKLSYVQNLQASGHKVAMIGDGLNDGPVLAMANTSIAMGRGVPLAQAQSDFIVMNNNISSIVLLLTEAKRTMAVVKQNLFWAFVYNIVCIPLAVAGWFACMVSWTGNGIKFPCSCGKCTAVVSHISANELGSYMDILFLLIPLSVILVLLILGGLWWSIYSGQFEEIESEGERILHED